MYVTDRRLRWGMILLALDVGMLLGLSQLLLGLLTFYGSLDWWFSLGLGALLYFLLPAMAGFRAAQPVEHRQTVGGRTGCLAELVGFVLVALVAGVLVVRLLVNPRLGQDPTVAVALGNTYLALLLVVVVLNAIGVLAGYFGGYFGGTLASRQASSSDQQSAGGEEV